MRHELHRGGNGIFLQSLSGWNNSLGCLHSPFSETRFYLALGFGQRKGDVGQLEGMLKGEEARLEEQRKSYGSGIRRGKGKGCGDLWKGRERGRGEAEGRVRDGDKEKEIFAFDVELLQRAGTENSPWFSVDLCPRLRS